MDDIPKILVVDDTPQMFPALQRTFGDQYIIVSANTGSEGLERARSEDPDLILLDINLPDMDGREVCIALKADPAVAHIPVIFMTGSDIGIDQTFEVGGADYVRKPFMAAEIIARVSAHIMLARSVRSLREMNAELDRRVAERTKELEATNAELKKEISGRQVVEKRLATLASIDPLTHLPRRGVFYRTVKRALEDGTHHALVNVKIDQLRETNQTFGFDAGDAQICAVATVLETLVDPDEPLGRVGGSRFSALLKGADFAERANEMVKTIASDDRASDAFAIEINLGVVPTIDGLNVNQIVMLAEEACARARAAGGNVAVELSDVEVETMLATHSLQSTAIVKSRFEADRFVLQKQRIVSADGEKEFGHEFYVQPPEFNRREIDRREFFRHVSRLRLRSRIDHWVLNRTSAINPAGRSIVSVTAPNADNESFWELAQTVIERRQKAGGTLAFQVQEKAFLSGASEFARRAHELGAETIIDDFTGQRLDFSELVEIPAIAVKLDSKFLRSVDSHEEARSMLRAVCELANAAGFKTIAKDVDEYRSVAALREVGVDYLQGNAIGKSASASHFG